MILKNKTGKFLVKKSIFLILLFLITSQIIFKINIEILLGLIIGFIISVLRIRELCALAEGFNVKCVNNFKISSIKYFFVQMFTIVVLILSIMKSISFFFATFIGIITIPIVIMINSFSEAIGITKNKFE